MGELIITYDNKTVKYEINTTLKDHVVDKIIADILKYYPSYALVDFKELW